MSIYYDVVHTATIAESDILLTQLQVRISTLALIVACLVFEVLDILKDDSSFKMKRITDLLRCMWVLLAVQTDRMSCAVKFALLFICTVSS